MKHSFIRQFPQQAAHVVHVIIQPSGNQLILLRDNRSIRVIPARNNRKLPRAFSVNDRGVRLGISERNSDIILIYRE